MRRLWRHWIDDARTRYVDPTDGVLKPERRRPWKILGPGELVLYALIVGMLVAGAFYIHTVSARFDAQRHRSDCIRVALRPIVQAAGEAGGTPRLLAAEHQYLRATEGLNPQGC